MKCKWCNGTGNRSGLRGDGCEHCDDTGVQIDPPWGGVLYPDNVFLDAGTFSDISQKCWSAKDRGTRHMVETIIRLLGHTWDEEDIQTMVAYWEDPTCNDNWGTAITRIAMRCKEKYIGI